MIMEPVHSPFSAKAGDIIFQPGDACAGFLHILSGQIKVILTGIQGREIVLYRVAPGDVCLQTFACLTTGVAYAAQGIVENDLTAQMIPSKQFQTALEDPSFRALVHEGVARRFAEMETLVEAMVFNSLDQRLVVALLRLADEDGRVVMTQDALAAECGSVREAVSRRLTVFAREGLIELARGQVKLVQPDALRQRAAHPV
jgi:CRP/FNR family transcriptional regulator, anaerobic regulatory protein